MSPQAKGRKEIRTETGLIKAKVILVMKNGIVLHGNGTFESIRAADNTAYITAYFNHPLPPPKGGSKLI